MENAKYYYDLGVEEYEKGNLLGSKEYFEKALEIQADYFRAWYGLGTVYHNLQDYPKAIEHYQKALEIQADYLRAWSNLGVVYFDLQDYPKAIKHFEKALEIQADYVHAWNGLGNVYNNLQDYQKAIEHFEKALKIQVDDVHTWNGLGNVYYHLQDYSKAIKHYEKALEIQADYVDAWYRLGNVCYHLYDYPKAIKHYEKALEIQADYVRAWYGLGNVYNNLKDYPKAIKHYEKALEIQADYVHAWYGLGNVYMNLLDYPKALKHYEKALEIQADYVHAWYGLGQAYAKKANPNYAAAHLCFNRFISLASPQELRKDVMEVMPFLRDNTDAPYMLKYVLDKVAVDKNLLNSHSIFGTLRRQCQSIDSYLSFLKYLPFKELDETIISHKKQLKVLDSELKIALNTAFEKDIRQQIHEQKELLNSLENQFNEAFYNTNKNTVSHWQLEALVNHFMGNCIEAHRIYDEEIETHSSDEMTMMDRFYYIKSANQFLHPEANYLLNDTIENEVGNLEINNQNPSEIYYTAQIYLMAWQSDETIEYLQKAHKLFLRADFYLPAQYMSVYTSDKLGNVEQRDKQIEKILKSKEKWFVEGWKVRPYDFENPDFLRQFKRYAHFSEVQEAINLIHTDYEKGYRFPPFYEAFEFKISETEHSNFERFIRKRGGLEIAKSLSETLGVEVGTYKNREFIIKEKIGELSILSDIEKSTESEVLENKLVEFIFAWKLDLLPKNKIETYSDIILYAVALEKINLMTALRLIVFSNVVRVFYEMNSENMVVQKFESTLYNFVLRGVANHVVSSFTGDTTSATSTFVSSFISSFSNNLIEYRKKIFGFDMPKITASESYKRFNEYYLEDLGIKLDEFKANKWIDEPFVENLQKDYEKQMAIFKRD